MFQLASTLYSALRVNQDILLTHSAPAMMRRQNDITDDIYEEAGTLVLWRWLGFDRFFPPNMPYQKVLRGCASVSLCRTSYLNKLMPESLYSMSGLSRERSVLSI